MNDSEIITNLYKSLCEASIKKDENTLNLILSDDYTLTHMTGMKQSKQEYIKSVMEGELKYYEAVHEDIETYIDGNRANVIGKTKTLASPFGMAKSWWRLRQDLNLKKQDNSWVIISSKASIY